MLDNQLAKELSDFTGQSSFGGYVVLCAAFPLNLSRGAKNGRMESLSRKAQQESDLSAIRWTRSLGRLVIRFGL
jgi:hypothetical protein